MGANAAIEQVLIISPPFFIYGSDTEVITVKASQLSRTIPPLSAGESASKLPSPVSYTHLNEVSKGVQMIQYQVVTLMTTNGQAPFVTVFMYLNEAKNEQETVSYTHLKTPQSLPYP